MPQVSKADVKLSFDDNGNEWRMAKDMGHAQGPDNYPKLNVEYDHQGEFTFQILNPKGTTFAKNNAFVAKQGQGSPGDFKKQFTVSGEGTDTLTVKVANANMDQPGKPYGGGDYHYELRFTDKPALDPIITNGGCCHGKDSALLYYALGAIALLALLFLVVRPMLKRRAPSSATRDRHEG